MNLSAVLKDLGSSANIKQLATALATAGALQGLDTQMGWDSAAPGASKPYTLPGTGDLMSWDTFNRMSSHAGLSAGINGGSFSKMFKDSLLSNIQSEIWQSTAGWIGDNGNALGGAGKTLAHGLTRGAIAEITGGKFAASAMSELASDGNLGTFE